MGAGHSVSFLVGTISPVFGISGAGGATGGGGAADVVLTNPPGIVGPHSHQITPTPSVDDTSSSESQNG